MIVNVDVVDVADGGGKEVVGMVMGGVLDEMALAVARGHLERKKEHHWMLLRGSLMAVESQDAPHR